MTPTEKSLYALTRFDIDDNVTIADEIPGVVTGIKVTNNGEDEYRVFYFDLCGNPQERWWSASHLESDEPEDTNSNVVCFDCAKAERESANATKH